MSNVLHPDPAPLFELRCAGLERMTDYDTGMDDVSLVLQPGDLALLLTEPGAERHPLLDVMSGLLALDSGEALFRGRNWLELSPDEQAASRGQIGRVFEDHGWIYNLDVDENVTLATRYHGRASGAEVAASARELARLAGLEDLPQTRPAMTEREVLRRAQWVRALLGAPVLLLLERPGHHLASGWRDDLRPLVERAREQGGAVVWLCEHEGIFDDPALKPTLKLRAERNRLRVERVS